MSEAQIAARTAVLGVTAELNTKILCTEIGAKSHKSEAQRPVLAVTGQTGADL
jgi:hypothetical protein